MIGVRAGDGRHRLDDVQPVLLVLRRADAPARREVLRVADGAGSEAEEVRVERDDDVGLVEAVERPSTPGAPPWRAP